jgi:erythromycin esterase-like protein
MRVRISRNKLHLWFAFTLFLIRFGGVPSRADEQTAKPAQRPSEIDPTVHALCGERVALLGEPPIHGLGNTLDFKVQLVRRLVDECHFNALFMESGLYDYVHIQRTLRAGQDVSDAMVSAAIGGLWGNREVQALVPYLTQKVKAGSLTLGGLDDQIGAGSYASREMAADLVQPLQGAEQSRCLALLQKHLLWQYTGDAPYGATDKEKLVGCLNEVQAVHPSTQGQSDSLEESRAMVDSLQRNLARNFTEDDFTKKDQELKWINDRDRSMYLNFEWLRHRLPPNSKIIVWAATVHTAKDLSGVPGMEDRVPLGSYIHKEFKRSAFSLGFSAYSGEYAFTHQPVRQLSSAPPPSIEAQTVFHTDADTVYLSLTQLHSLNAAPARLLGTDFKTAQWGEVVDGLVVFRQERAPMWINAPNK